jgi:hypothetical protein
MSKNNDAVNVLNVLNVTPVATKVDKEKPAPVVELVAINQDKPVKIKTNSTFNVYLGNKRWYFEKGVEINVPKHVKEVLQRMGALEVL